MKNLINVVASILLIVVVTLIGYAWKQSNDTQVALEQRVASSDCQGDFQIYCVDQQGNWFTSKYVLHKLSIAETVELAEKDVPAKYLIAYRLTKAKIDYTIE